ncbi:MAG: glycosyltransferase family 1 protein [Actinobacteria bacterium]|nr:glycosyltransferase family 1 protein [Actinomycetota bacterium]
MRIAHVANFYGPRSGGLRTTMHRLGHGYQQRGHEVLHIVPGAELEREWTESGQRLTIPGRVLAGSGGYRVIVNVARVRRLLEEFAPDALEVSDRFTLSSLGDWARDRGVPSAVFSHETLTGLSETFLRAPLLTNAPVNWWNHRLARRFDHVVATTAFAAREFQRLGVTNLIRVPLGVDLDVFHPARRDEVWRAAQLENGDDVLLVHCGRLSPEKKVDRSIDTLIALRKRGVRARLLVAGDGPTRAALERQAHGYPVTFLGFVHDRTALARLLASADLVLAPGPLETFCLAALEALASGTPVVASASSAVREVLGVDDGQFATGAVVADSPRLFADAVQAVLAEPAALRREATRRRAEQFPWSTTIDRMLSLHQSSHERRAA